MSYTFDKYDLDYRTEHYLNSLEPDAQARIDALASRRLRRLSSEAPSSIVEDAKSVTYSMLYEIMGDLLEVLEEDDFQRLLLYFQDSEWLANYIRTSRYDQDTRVIEACPDPRAEW